MLEADESFLNEKYTIVFEYLDAEIKTIRERQENLKNKKLYSNKKFYNNVKDYTDYVSKKTNKFRKICELLTNQINNLPNICSNFSEDHSNYKSIEELKSQCKEIKKTIDFIEKEREDLISIVPPVNLEKLHSVTINIYNPIFDFISEFLYRLSLVEIKDLEDLRLKKYLIDENGKKVIDMKFNISFDKEISDITKETENVTRKVQKVKKSKKRKQCYIATVVYGDFEAPEVIKLRNWRDKVLVNKIFGKLIIEIYYFLGKRFAKLINKSLVLKIIVRYFLDKFIKKLNIN